MKKIILIGILLAVVFYLGLSFLEGTFDVSQMSKPIKSFTLVFWATCTLCFYGFGCAEEENNLKS